MFATTIGIVVPMPSGGVLRVRSTERRQVRETDLPLKLAAGLSTPSGSRASRAAASALADDGLLVMEIGFGQAEAAARIVAESEPLQLLRIRNDLAGTPRTVVAVREKG